MVKNLKYLRNQKGISQQKLAAEIGISQQSINKYENHDIEPDIDTLISLANYFETTVDFLIGRTDDGKIDSDTQNLLIANRLFSKYLKLSQKEQNCVKTIVDTFSERK